MKKQITLALTAIATLAAISATTMMPSGVAFAQDEGQANNQVCILSDCLQVNQENDEGDNNVGDVTFNDEIEEGEENVEMEDAQTLIATPH